MNNKEEKTAPPRVYKQYGGMSIDMYALEGQQLDYTLMRGRALLNPERKVMHFVQNRPRGERSVEVGRTMHSRFVCRPDGDYTVTFRFGAGERQIREQLLAEVREMVSKVKAHYGSRERRGE